MNVFGCLMCATFLVLPGLAAGQDAPADGGAGPAAVEAPEDAAPAPAQTPDPERVPDAEQASELAPDPEPEPAPDPDPEPDPNIAACLDAAGPVTAGVPASKDEAAARRAALIAAMEPCTAAAEAPEAPAEVLFLAAEIAQGKRDLATAYGLLERAAGLGLGAAETRLGDYHLFGLAPGGEDERKAIARYEAASVLGDPAGMTTLALMYRVGKGVPRDATRMVALLHAASEAGYHFAQYRLAQTYLNGEGIPGRRDDALGIPDPEKAVALYEAAAEGGNITAALELAALYGDPASGVPEDPEKQARLTRLVYRAGVVEAAAALGVLYETGRGVVRNPNLAARLYVEALETGEVSFEALRKGAPGGWDRDTAIAFQEILKERGLYTGALDGVIGPGSTAAARALSGN